MPYPVKHLMEGRSQPVTAFREDRMIDALNKMVASDYSQLPVIDQDGRPIGIIHYEGIIRGIRNFNAQLDELWVRDVMASAPVFHLDDDLFEMLEQLKQTNSVLIEDSGGMLAGIITSYDSTEYFRKRAENLMRVEDIEAMIKDFILIAYTLPDGSRDERKLSEAIVHITPNGEIAGKVPKTFDELTLGQYISLLSAKATWHSFVVIFKLPRERIIKLLEDIRVTRNDLAHFRGDISSEKVDQLRFCSEWLARCWDEYQDQKTREMVSTTTDSSEILKIDSSETAKMEVKERYNEKNIKDRLETFTSFRELEKELRNQNIDVIAELWGPKESRYIPLVDFLQSIPGNTDDVKLSFDEIEKIIGGDLPASAYKHRAWWANDAEGHPHSQLWLEAGWRTTYVNLTDKRVTFARIREREKAYIDFFGSLLNELQKKVDFPVRTVSPDGTNWVVCHNFAPTGTVIGGFNYSFARGKQFRVELYIDTYDQKNTKEIFDRISAFREEIESVLGEVAWERINDKRASRIAIYHPGAITDSKEKLSELREWAVSQMIAFYKAIEPVATRAALEVLKP